MTDPNPVPDPPIFEPPVVVLPNASAAFEKCPERPDGPHCYHAHKDYIKRCCWCNTELPMNAHGKYRPDTETGFSRG